MHDYQIHPIKPKDGTRGIHKNSFYCRVVDRWNTLPSSVVEAPTMNTFKNRLDQHWKELPLKYDHFWDQRTEEEDDEEE